MISNNDIIGDSLDLPALTIDNDTALPTAYRPSRDESDSDQIDTDLRYVRQNMYDLIEKGHRSIDELLNVADQSQHPRAYEVLANMLKTMGDMNKDLIDMHEKKQKITGQKPEAPDTVNNNLFVGSTSDLLKLMRKDGKDED